MRWRGLAASCCPAVPDRSVSAGPAGLLLVSVSPIARPRRARGTGLSRYAGPDCSGPAPPLTVRRGLPGPIARSRFPSPDCPSWFPVPIARVQLLRGSPLLAVRRSRLLGPAPTESGCPADLARSLGTRQRGTASPRTPRLLKTAVARPAPTSRPAIARLSTPRNSSPLLGNPLRTAVSRCSPRPGSRPPGRSPFPVTRRFLVGVPRPTRAFRQHFPTSFASTGQSTGGGVVPRKPPLSTASSTGTSTASLRTVQHLDSPRTVQACRRTGSAGRAPAAAGSSVGQEPRGQDEQPAGRVEIAGFAGVEGGHVGREHGGATRRSPGQAARVRLGERSGRQRVGHRPRVGRVTQWTAMTPTLPRAGLAALALLVTLRPAARRAPIRTPAANAPATAAASGTAPTPSIDPATPTGWGPTEGSE